MWQKFLIFLVLILSSCNSGIKKNFLGNFYLVAPDIDEQMALSYHVPSDGPIYGDVIKATVFAVGYNDKYIIAKQHPDNNRAVTNYFILPIKTNFDWKSKNGLMGPLTLEQFKKISNDLKISKIEFSICYKDLQ